MRKLLAGFVLGVLFAIAAFGAVTTFTSVQGRGTYSSGYVVLPRCASVTETMEFGSMCADMETGFIVYHDASGTKSLTGRVIP